MKPLSKDAGVLEPKIGQVRVCTNWGVYRIIAYELQQGVAGTSQRWFTLAFEGGLLSKQQRQDIVCDRMASATEIADYNFARK